MRLLYTNMLLNLLTCAILFDMGLHDNLELPL